MTYGELLLILLGTSWGVYLVLLWAKSISNTCYDIFNVVTAETETGIESSDVEVPNYPIADAKVMESGIRGEQIVSNDIFIPEAECLDNTNYCTFPTLAVIRA
jgi:hypothetical protein